MAYELRPGEHEHMVRKAIHSITRGPGGPAPGSTSIYFYEVWAKTYVDITEEESCSDDDASED